MTYLQPVIKPGYNEYLNIQDNPEVGMDVGLLVLEAGESWSKPQDEREAACLLFEGSVTFAWNNHSEEAMRRDPFRDEAYCLHVNHDTAFTVTAHTRSELYFQAAINPVLFENRLYTPSDVMVQHAGDKGELLGAMRRDIKTFFDYESQPKSKMVLGEVLNFPGKWSSYPPHHHPQPEVYFHRFDKHHGFGASFGNGDVNVSKNNGLTVITDGFHSQTSAPGYCMCYVWGIRHLPGNPWQKTRIDDPGHEWLWKSDANEHIFNPEAQV